MSEPDDAESEVIDFRPKLHPWVHFELEVVTFMEKLIAGGKSMISKHCARVRHRPSYFSKDRNSNITFDVSIEVSENGDFDNVILLWLIECKDYPNRNVKVEEVEEFHSKMRQVGAHKGTIFTRIGFDSGGLGFAKTHRIGLCTLIKKRRIVILQSASGGMFWVDDLSVSFFSVDDAESKVRDISDVLSEGLNRFDIVTMPVYHNREPFILDGF